MANKYLDNAGLSRMWTRIKSYLSSNYATKSALSSGLSGKANSSHTHSTSQITNLASYVDGRIDDKISSSSGITASSSNATTTTGSEGGGWPPTQYYILQSISVGQMKPFKATANADGKIKVRLPSGGSYIVITQTGSESYTSNGLLAGGTTLFSRASSGGSDPSYSDRTGSGFYLRVL